MKIDLLEECDGSNRNSSDECALDCKKERFPSQNEERRRAPNITEVCVNKNHGNGLLDGKEQCD